MKKLTYSAIAKARLRANKRQYGSLVFGIFLSIFLVSLFVLAVYGVYQNIFFGNRIVTKKRVVIFMLRD